MNYKLKRKSNMNKTNFAIADWLYAFVRKKYDWK